MDLEKVFSWVTPLMLGALLGAYWILDGLSHTVNGTKAEQRDYGLLIVLGLPLLLGCVGTHFLIRRLANHNTLYVWIIEAMLVGAVASVFMRS
ncbi:hypothetical protein [Spirosoma sp. KUDC1026]|uniref:hypothetical protein n=1 Tax=Spirosoma sp. KUDC1026 TaxID=2745947 RepID=UPI00159BD31D|nr:hypothetical protein [Spirosoma sp. KUDC1026]QKZ12183.1 hypothetical protein HU175_05900 [Spirosoma sp. KUDC1026]